MWKGLTRYIFLKRGHLGQNKPHIGCFETENQLKQATHWCFNYKIDKNHYKMVHKIDFILTNLVFPVV